MDRENARPNEEPNEQPHETAERESLFKAVESAFEEVVDTVVVDIDYEKFRLISLSELPMENLIQMAGAEAKEQMRIMHKNIKVCLVNPEQWQSVRGFNFEQFTEFVKIWMRQSGVVIDDGEHGENDYN
jgi:hypothetical protein